MAAWMVVSLCSTLALMLFSVVFKVAGKMRLTLPVVYFVAAVISTFFTDWVPRHEKLVLYGLYLLTALCVLSWFVSLAKYIRKKRDDKRLEENISWQIQRAKELGVPLDTIRFTEKYELIDPRTGQPVVYGAPLQFRD